MSIGLFFAVVLSGARVLRSVFASRLRNGKAPFLRHFRHGRKLSAILVTAALTVLPLAARAAPEVGFDVGLKDSMVSDPRSGAAMFGYDPVAYFIDGKALQGSRSNALLWNGVKWHFVSPRNKALFERAPEVYMPRIGGLDPVRLADGFQSAADPRIFLVDKETLWLFRSERSRAQFLADRTAHQRALANWRGAVFGRPK